MSITRALRYNYLITWTAYLRILRTCHYDVMVGCWFTGQGKKGDCVGKKVNGGPVGISIMHLFC